MIVVTTGCIAGAIGTAGLIKISINEAKIKKMKEIIEKRQSDKFYKIKSLTYDKKLTPCILDNLIYLMSRPHNELFIEKLIADDPKALILYVTQNLNKLVSTWEGQRIIEELVIQAPDMAIPPITQKFEELITSDKGCSIIEKITKKRPDILTPYIIQNLDTLLDNGDFLIALALINKNPNALVPYSIQNLNKLVSSNSNRFLLKEIIKENLTAAEKLTPLALKINDLDIFDTCTKIFPSCNKEIERTIKEMGQDGTFNKLLADIIYARSCNTVTFETDIPSKKHLKNEIENISESMYQLFKQSTINKTLYQSLESEKNLIGEGYIVFYHGRRRIYNFAEKVFSLIISTLTNKQAQEFVYTHIKKPVYAPQELNDESAFRIHLVQNGNLFDSKHDPRGKKNREKILFLNHFVLGNNSKYNSSSSFGSMLDNGNVGSFSISLEDIFAMYNLNSVYEKYKERLMKLENDYNTISNYGQLLQIGIKPEKVKACVYLTSSGGPLTSLDIPGKGKTNNIMEILKHLDENPVDRTEFALINTWDEDGGLHPKNMKINVIDPVDHDPNTAAEKRQLDMQKDELFEEIKKNIFLIINKLAESQICVN